jgi:starch-binding outer membrane protein, SusD/RagB family
MTCVTNIQNLPPSVFYCFLIQKSLKMKNIKVLIGLFIVITLVSCQKFLEEDPKSLISADKFYKTNADVISATNAIYFALRDDVTGSISPIWMAEMTTDDTRTNPGAAQVQERLEVENLIYASRHIFIRNIWNSGYKAIGYANAVLANVDTLTSKELSPAIVRRSFAEARFLRAFVYTRLVQLYGDVPLITKPVDDETLFPNRAPKADVYKQIIEDLQYAEENLANFYAYNNNDGGRATKGAAKALLGYVYLVMAGFPMNDNTKWQAAADKLKEVIDRRTTFGVNIMPVYRDIFDVTRKATNTENLFYYKGTSGQTANFNAFTRMQYWYFQFVSIIPTREAVDTLYNFNDARRLVSLARKTSSTTVGSIATGTATPIIGKYLDNLANSNDNQNDFHALRYSDVVLMYAEALIELGGTANLDLALTHINSVRRPHSGLPDLTYTTQDDLRQKLRTERRREFAFEGKRYYDLIRWNIFVPTMKAHMAREYSRPITDFDYINENRMLLPLPFIDLAANPNLKQNPGY